MGGAAGVCVVHTRVRIYVFTHDLFQGVDTHSCGGWQFVFGRETSRLETRAGADAAVGGQNFFFLQKTSVVLLRPFN